MDDLRPRLERALAGSYVFERELGGGGMSRTYLAREKALDRRVVVKVLAPELLAGISVERFRREVLLAAQLQHPHVVPVLTAGDSDGLPWFTMPFVEGESLRQRLGQGPMGITEIVGILRDVARALAYAHGHGVVHRDIKPDNVLLSAGSATVTDFGIAKAINAARQADGPSFGTQLTVAGTSIGTPLYMAPEQAAGDPATDHRADLYAFGAMAYELLAGQPPFHGYHPTALLAAHLSETPDDVRAHRPDCPPALAELVMRCLEKQPGDRPQSATDVARLLETITTSATGAAAPAILAGGRLRFAQAFSLWAGLTAVVTLTAWAATSVIGLPDWVFPGAVGVMLAGLPVIVATWYAQKVAHRAYTATPTRTPGGTAALAVPQGTMATIAMKASPHLSWRRAWLGGGIAVGAFAALVVGFMVMRAAGIGPFGSLRGRGEFGDNETIVVADFVSPAGDSTLGATIAEALRTDLAQSRSLRVLTRANVREVLRLMQRPVESAVLFDLAREIATREGAKAVLDGGIERIGTSYVVSARLVGALDGRELATFRETARGEDELLEAVGRLTRDVRDAAGESLRNIQRSKDLERVTTPSLAALRKYVEGSVIADERGEAERGIAMLQEAVTLDTAFAMAWRKIAVLLGNEGRERARAIDAIERAYRHRDRLSELERLATEGYYFTRGPRPDRDRALAAYEGVIALDSLSTAAYNNAGVLLAEKREFEKAREYYRRVTQLPRSFGGSFTNLLQMQIRTGQLSGLDSTRDAFRARFPESADLWEGDSYVTWAEGDLEASDSIARAVAATARTGRAVIRANAFAGDLSLLRGRPAEALRFYTASRQAERRVSGQSRLSALQSALDSAFIEARFLERPSAAGARIATALRAHPISELAPLDRPWQMLAVHAAYTRDAALARQALAGFERDIAPTRPDPEGAMASLRSIVAVAEGRYLDAVRELAEADRRLSVPVNVYAAKTAEAYDLADRPDSAIVWYERYLAVRDPFADIAAEHRAATFKRLGELYENRGETAKAIEYYERFVDLWKDAEPALQPKVREVQARLDRLRPPR